MTPVESTARDLITAAVADIATNRAVIDQAKVMLILVYGVDEDGAFEMLRRRSQSTNTKLRTLAAQLVADYRSLCNGEALPSRAVYDKALMSVHERIADESNSTGQHGSEWSVPLAPSRSFPGTPTYQPHLDPHGGGGLTDVVDPGHATATPRARAGCSPYLHPRASVQCFVFAAPMD